jgi:hypothetical protein
MTNELKIRTLLERFFDGETTLEEEQLLYAFFQQTAEEQLAEDLRPLRGMFLDLRELGAKGDTEVATMSQHRGTRGQRRGAGHRWGWRVAAALLVLVAGGAWLLFGRSGQPAEGDDEVVAFVYGQRTTDPAVVLSEMQHTMTALSADDSNDVEQQLKTMFSN